MVSRTKSRHWRMLLSDPSADTRRKAAKRLGNPDCRDAVVTLCLSLNDSSWRVRRAAAQSLGKIGDSDALPSLCLALKDPSKGVRRRAIAAIGQIGHEQGPQAFGDCEQASEALCACLGGRSPDIAVDAVFALVRIGMPALSPVCRALTEAEHTAYGYPLQALKQIVGVHRESALWALVADDRLSPAQRWKALDMLRGYEGGRLFRAYFADTRRYCERLRAASQKPEIRAGAAAMLDFVTLARASEPDPSAQRQTLLRAAHGAAAASVESPDVLLRGSDALAEMAVGAPIPLLHRVWAAIAQWVRRLRGNHQRTN